MSGKKVIPIVITARSGEPNVITAFETAEHAEKSKIMGWATSFDFELTEVIIVDLGSTMPREQVLSQIVDSVTSRGTEGIVVASSEYLRRAGLLSTLPDALTKVGKQLWIADMGSLPIDRRISA
ncbi:MAG: hypothetical protein U0105_09105 [Candidatus Obscuribacterales bacterium]